MQILIPFVPISLSPHFNLPETTKHVRTLHLVSKFKTQSRFLSHLSFSLTRSTECNGSFVVYGARAPSPLFYYISCLSAYYAVLSGVILLQFFFCGKRGSVLIVCFVWRKMWIWCCKTPRLVSMCVGRNSRRRVTTGMMGRRRCRLGGGTSTQIQGDCLSFVIKWY